MADYRLTDRDGNTTGYIEKERQYSSFNDEGWNIEMIGACICAFLGVGLGGYYGIAKAEPKYMMAWPIIGAIVGCVAGFFLFRVVLALLGIAAVLMLLNLLAADGRLF